MLRLVAAQAETLWDEALPIEVRELPADLAALDVLLSDPGLMAPFSAHWQREALVSGVSAAGHGRPTIAIETCVRLMVLKARYGWGYRTLVAEVSDSIHLRRFCRIALTDLVCDESTVRKLTRRIGQETVNEIIRMLIASAVREKRFRARAVRIDSTVIEADIKYPTDAGLAAQGVTSLAREGRKLAKRVHGEKITDRLISLSDPDARPIRKGKLGKPTEFGYVAQIAELTPNTKRGARGLILPAASLPGNPGENQLLPQTVTELQRLGLSPKEVALDGGFNVGPTSEALDELAPERVFIAGRQQPGSKRTQRRLQRYRTGAEGRISHLKRGYGLRRSR